MAFKRGVLRTALAVCIVFSAVINGQYVHDRASCASLPAHALLKCMPSPLHVQRRRIVELLQPTLARCSVPWRPLEAVAWVGGWGACRHCVAAAEH